MGSSSLKAVYCIFVLLFRLLCYILGQTGSFTMTDVLLHQKYQYTDGSTTLYGYYYKTPVKYEWNNNYYYIPASYVRATVGP